MSCPPTQHEREELEKLSKKELIELVLEAESEATNWWEGYMGDDL